MIRADIPTYVASLAYELAWCTLRDAEFARHCFRTKNTSGYTHYLGRAEGALEACLRVQGRWFAHPDASHALRWLLRFTDDVLP